MSSHFLLDDAAREQASLYALDALAPEEARAYEAHLGECPICRAEVDSLRRVASNLALLAPEATPPEIVWRRIRDRIRGGTGGDPGHNGKAAPPSESDSRNGRSRTRPLDFSSSEDELPRDTI